jgi:hypothetical protein
MPPYGKEARDSIYNYLKKRGVPEDKIKIPDVFYRELLPDEHKFPKEEFDF